MTRSFILASSLFLMALPTAVAGQATYAIDKGALALGGSISWSSSGGDLYENSDGDRYNAVLINPRVMVFVTPGLAVGGDVYVESASQGDFDSTTIAAGPAVAYFFGGPETSTYPFISGFVGYGKTSTSQWDGSGLAFGVGAGAAFMISSAVALTVAGSYRVQDFTVDQLDDSFGGNTLGIDFGVEAFVF